MRNVWTAFFFFIVAAALPAEGSEASPAETIRGECRTGSLLFSQGDCLAVRAYTNSPYTHVALVFVENGECLVFDSMNGTGVRCLTLTDYLETQSPDRVHLFHPARDMTRDEEAALKIYLESQLGRPYAVAHHITGKPCEGVHCSEYVASALADINWLTVKNPPRISPASLAEGIETHHVYQIGSTIELPHEIEPIPEPATRCGRLWQDTKVCMIRCCQKMSRLFLCR